MTSRRYVRLVEEVLEENTAHINYVKKELANIKKKPKITLYRVIYVTNKNQINKNDLGIHYVKDLGSFHEEMLDWLYLNAKKKSPNLEYDDLWLVTVETRTDNIDYEMTLEYNIDHPYEEEIQLKTSKVNIKSIEPYYS
jgi:hypothetical protein